MRKTKITSFDKEGIREGRSLEAVLSEIDNDLQEDGSPGDKHRAEERNEGTALLAKYDGNEEEDQILYICRLSFTSTEKARAMGRLILSRGWSKIVLEKTSGRFVSLVLQDSVVSTRVLEIKQHQRYDGIKWNFGLDWFPNGDSLCCPIEEIHMTGVRFRGGEELKFFNSLANGLERSTAGTTATTDNRPIGLRVLNLNACRFLHPDVQYPILFRGLKAACFGTLERLWMPKAPGLNDDRFEELFEKILLAHDDNCSILELGFSYNGCGWKGSRAVCSFLEAPQSARLKILYLNRQQGELNLQGILRAASIETRKLHLNLSQNYVSSFEMLQELRDFSGSHGNESQENDNEETGLHIQLDSMTFEVPEAVFPGNGSNQHHNSGSYNKNSNHTNAKADRKKQNFEDYHQNLSKEEIAKLNVACGRVKYVLGRASTASDRSNEPSSQSFFSSLAALDCVLPDLLTILRLQEKQNAPKPHENEATNGSQQQPLQQQRQYRNWLPTFLRKSIKGKIEVLKPWLLSASKVSDAASQTGNDEVGGRQPVMVTQLEQGRLKALWIEVEALHANIARHAGRYKHSPVNNPSGTSPGFGKTKSSRREKHGRKGVAEIPMTPRDNPLVKAAYEAIPVISTSILESSNDTSPCLSLQMEVASPDSNDVRPVPPIFIDTAEALMKLRDDQFRRPPPHKLPRMVAVDSEWYYTQNATSEEGGTHTQAIQPKKTKNRSMSVATLQIAYVDANKEPMILRSYVIDLLSNQPGFQKVAKEYVSWLFGSASCDMMVLGFAFGGDLRQLRKYAGISGNIKIHPKNNQSDRVASMEAVASRCLDIQRLLAAPEDLKSGRVPGLKKCAQLYFQKPLKKDDQTSDWRERPLRPSQLEYAALDAVILLVLLSQKKHEDELSALSTAVAME